MKIHGYKGTVNRYVSLPPALRHKGLPEGRWEAHRPALALGERQISKGLASRHSAEGRT